MRPLITLTTDFGTADGYVGEMKGVLLTLVPDALLVDISHDIPPHDVDAARLAVARWWRRFPPATVHLVVIDPGVGSARAAIAVSSDERFLVGPDNGALSPALLAVGARTVSLPIPHGVSATFHGRDVFAPAAAHLAAGEAIETLGSPLMTPIVRRTPEPHRLTNGVIAGEVIATDRFGNLITNLIAPRGGSVEIAGRAVGPLHRTYSDAEPGAVVAIVGSTGLVEIAVRDASAAALLQLGRGAPVRLTPPSDA